MLKTIHQTIHQIIQRIQIRYKLIALIVIAGILPIVILLTFFTSKMKADFDEKKSLSISLAYNHLENMMNESFSYVDNVIHDLEETISQLDSNQLDDLNEKISVITKDNDYINSISWFQNSYETKGHIRLYDDIINEVWYSEIIKKEIIPIFENDKGRLFWLYDINKASLIVIEIDMSKLNKIWNNTLIFDIRGKIFITDPEQRIIANNANIFQNEQVIYFNEEDYDYTLIQEHSLSELPIFKGWQYYLYTDELLNVSSFWQNSISIIFFSVLIVAILLTLTMNLASYINKRLLKLNEAMSCDNIDDMEALPNMGYDEIGKTVLMFNQLVERMKELVLALQLEKEKSDQLVVEKSIALHRAEENLQSLALKNEQINTLIHIDPLTGLQNRFDIMNEIKIAIEKSMTQFAILFFDIDNFKYINDTYGHDLGDLVIVETSNLLKNYQSDHIKIGRFGGDEFLMLINLGFVDLNETVKSIQKEFEKAVQVDQNKFYLTTSIGVSLYPNHGSFCQELIQNADLALYESKSQGKNMMTLFDASLAENLEEKIMFQNQMKEAFHNEELSLYYQPYFNANDKKLEGFEALVRWYSPVLGQVNPYKLVQEAERIGLIVELGEWIFTKACEFAKQLSLNGTKAKVNINISMIQVLSPCFVDRVKKIIEETEVNTDMIVLEMTETVLLKSIDKCKYIIDDLRKLGFELALDDFGTGYSSLNYLKRLPVSILKIDRSFISNIHDNQEDIDFIKLIVSIAHKRGLKVVAEGIESEDQIKLLVDANIDLLQGYYFSQALSEVKAFNYLKKM